MNYKRNFPLIIFMTIFLYILLNFISCGGSGYEFKSVSTDNLIPEAQQFLDNAPVLPEDFPEYWKSYRESHPGWQYIEFVGDENHSLNYYFSKKLIDCQAMMELIDACYPNQGAVVWIPQGPKGDHVYYRFTNSKGEVQYISNAGVKIALFSFPDQYNDFSLYQKSDWF